jgi:hypothetical protein
MKRSMKPGICLSTILFLTAASTPVLAEHPVTTLATLLDRAQIEDLLVDYYGQLGSGRDDFGAFYVDDGVLDVNGRVAQGKKAIEELYRKAAQDNPPKPGTSRMVLSNVKIVVNGEAATADVIWTGVHSATVNAVPDVYEQGKERDELLKRNGRWYFKHRAITSDGGMPATYNGTYRKR